MELNLKATNVLKRTIQAESEGKKIIIEEGGSRSSKTWSIFQFFILKALAGDGIGITIVRSHLSWIKATLLKDFEEILDKYKINYTPEININRDSQIYYINGSEFAFFGLDYAQKLHGRPQHWFWINEAMEVKKEYFDQLEMRTRVGGIIDYNPVDDNHWVFELQKRPDVALIKSTMLDNPFLPNTIINKIKSYEPTEQNILQGTADDYMWQVYGLGNKAKLKGSIFSNWDIVDNIPEDAKFIAYGLDFGYSSDPTSLVELYLYNNEIYVNELIYETNLTNQDIADRMSELGINVEDEIYADSAEPKSIEEIYRLGFNVQAVEKGADSIRYGINLLKSYKMWITKRSINLENELRKYKWAEDRTGRSLNKPVDNFNHAIDALRYAAMMTLNADNEIEEDDFDVI